MENYLTEREKEVFALLNQGLDEKDIAEKLRISIHTVKSDVSKIDRIIKQVKSK